MIGEILVHMLMRGGALIKSGQMRKCNCIYCYLLRGETLLPFKFFPIVKLKQIRFGILQPQLRGVFYS